MPCDPFLNIQIYSCGWVCTLFQTITLASNSRFHLKCWKRPPIPCFYSWGLGVLFWVLWGKGTTGYWESKTLQWHYNDRDGVSNHRRVNCLLNCLFWHRWKKTSKLCVTSLCYVTGGFPSHRASNVENVSIWWYHHEYLSQAHFIFVHWTKCPVNKILRLLYVLSSQLNFTVILTFVPSLPWGYFNFMQFSKITSKGSSVAIAALKLSIWAAQEPSSSY